MNQSRQRSLIETLYATAVATERVGSGKLAAAVVYKGSVVSVGFNQRKTHPMQVKWTRNPNKTTLHAEINAICRASRIIDEYEFSKSSIYVVRVKKDPVTKKWILGMAMPCGGCFDCIQAFGIKEVFYSTNNGEIERLN